MGASQSSPTSSSAQHVFSSDTPVQFSQELIDSLQASSEVSRSFPPAMHPSVRPSLSFSVDVLTPAMAQTNSTRAKTLDLHIQQRVAAELSKLQSRESKRLSDIQAELASSPLPDASTSSTQSKLTASIPGLKDSSDEAKRKAASSAKVAEEIENLKKKLGERKTLKDLPKEVERAREEVVGCLRLNDRRPLDCWREVEAFKREVGRLEMKFVGDVL